LLFSGLPFVLLLAACGPQYGPAYLGSNNAYMVKPAYKGTRVNTVTLNGRYNRGAVYYDGERNNTGEISAHVTFLRRGFYYSGGLFGYFGQYQVDTLGGDGVSLTPYRVNGFGGRHELGARIELSRDWDFLMGVGLQTFSERGKFTELSRDKVGEVISKATLFLFFGPDVLDIEFKSVGFGYNANFNVRYAPLESDYLLGLRYCYDLSVAGNSGVFITNNFLRTHQLTLHGSYRRFSGYCQFGFGRYRYIYDLQDGLFHAGLAYSIPLGRKRPVVAPTE
jgi:hypothetical protein